MKAMQSVEEGNEIRNHQFLILPPTKDPESDFPPNLDQLFLAGRRAFPFFLAGDEIFPSIFSGKEEFWRESPPGRQPPAAGTTITIDHRHGHRHRHHHPSILTHHRPIDQSIPLPSANTIMTSIDEDAFTIQLEDSRDVQMHFEVIKSENFAAVFHQYAKMKAYSSEFIAVFGIRMSIILRSIITCCSIVRSI